MQEISSQIKRNQKYLTLLAKQYPTTQSVFTEIINLRAILNLPKGTEHFLSDLHGEYEAFTHILNNCSGVIREKVNDVFEDTLSEQQRAELCTLIYYPRLKLEGIKDSGKISDDWYESTLLQMIDVCKAIANKYTRSKVRKAMPPEYSYIIDELLHADYGEANQSLYYNKIMESILALSNADDFIVALATVIKRLAVDRLHIVGDIFDRGPRPDLIMDQLMEHHSVDIQWGNHDILWMGAAAGHAACMAAVITNSAAYGNLGVLEQGYGINLRPLALFADKTYAYSPVFRLKLQKGEARDKDEVRTAAKIYKAITMIMFKLEGQLWARNPQYGMEHRRLLDKIDLDQDTVALRDQVHPMRDSDLPTLLPDDPYRLTEEEAELVEGLRESFLESERLQRHVRFLYTSGSLFKCYNQNLMYHGCIPMNEDGSFTQVELCGRLVAGAELLRHGDRVVRQAYFGSGRDKEQAMDAMWYLWCGKHSPLFGREQMTTFERLFVADQETWAEKKNAYYRYMQEESCCQRILLEFGLYGPTSHIINGHIPVQAAKGESPVKGGGKLIVIDGGFSKAYQPKTGIAGYTLIYNSYGMRLSAHMPFESIEKAVEENMDIHSSTDVFETMQQRMRVMDTDIGQDISDQIYDLSLLLSAYRTGVLQPKK